MFKDVSSRRFISIATERRSADLHDELAHRAEKHSLVAELGVFDVALDGKIDVEHIVLVREDIDTRAERNVHFRLHTTTFLLNLRIAHDDVVLSKQTSVLRVVHQIGRQDAARDLIAEHLHGIG